MSGIFDLPQWRKAACGAAAYGLLIISMQVALADDLATEPDHRLDAVEW